MSHMHMERVSASVWPTFLDTSGRTLDEYSIRKWTFYKGMLPDIRTESWKFLLGYYPFSSTSSEREVIDRQKKEEYEKLSHQLRSVLFSNADGCSEFAKYLKVIEKDSVRTDCHINYFSNEDGNDNVKALKRVLSAFVLYDPQLGYVQGMNELLSPLMVVLQSEHQSFWCLVNLLQRMRSNFMDLTLSQPLCDMARLCLYADSQLHRHIDQVYEGEDWLFCFRGLLLNFKREFSFDDVLSLWETIWCNHSTTHYDIFVAVAILVYYKSVLMQCFSIESLMEFSMGICGCVSLEPVQKIARSLLEQLKSDEYCPYELRHLVSRDGCAPPPLVGFVRARQKLTTLHSNKIKHQRDEMWHMMFGTTSAKDVTTPFILSPRMIPNSNTAPTQIETDQRGRQSGNQGLSYSHSTMQNQSISLITEPPKTGFVPRMADGGISVREAIRQLPTSPFVICSAQSSFKEKSANNATNTSAHHGGTAPNNDDSQQSSVIHSINDNHSEIALNFDFLRSEPQLIIS